MTAAFSSKIKLVISDFHLSRGKWLKDGRRNPLEDFHEDERFREFLDHYSTGPYETADVELIVNGDFFDPLAVIALPRARSRPARSDARSETRAQKRIIETEYPLEVEEPAAIDKFARIIEGHPAAFEALRDFLRRGKRVVFRWGNHDAAILWKGVQDLLLRELKPPRPEQVGFQVKAYVFDRICVDHGHQYETLNHFDESNLFIERRTRDGVKLIQNLPFGSFFVLGFLNRIKLQRSFINQVQPFRTYLRLALLLDPLFFFVNGIWVLWFFVKMRFITHPMRFARFRKTLLLIVEAIHRPSLEEIAEEILTSAAGGEAPFDTLILGHNHQATTRVFPGGKQYINTGTWTPITSLEMGTLGHRILRTYALIEYLEGADKPRASLKIWNGSPRVSEDFA